MALFERRPIFGGTAVTEEFHPGFRNSTASYTVSLLHPQVIRDLRLHEHGLRIVERPLLNYLVEAPGTGPAHRPHQRRHATRAGRALTTRCRTLRRLPRAARCRRRAAEGPAAAHAAHRPASASATCGRRCRVGRAFRALPLETQRAVHELFTRSAGDLLDGWFEDAGIKAAYGFDSIVGNYASPYTPGSAYVLLHHAFGEVNGKRGIWGHAIGGMGAITQAMATEATAHGARIEVDAAGGARAGGKRPRHAACSWTAAARCARGASPPTSIRASLYLNMLAAGDVDPAVRERMQRYRAGSASFRMNVALSELPRFDGSGPQGSDIHRSGILIAPDARLHGPRACRCAPDRHVARTGGRDADPEHAG